MTVLVASFKLAADLYIGWRISNAVDLISPYSSPFWGWMVIGFFFLFYLLPLIGLIQYTAGYEVDLMTYPKPLVYLFWGGVAFSFQVLTWILAMDILKFAINTAAGINAPFIDQGYGVLVTVVSVVILLFSAFKMYKDTTTIETERIKIKIDKLPSELEGFKIVHISDIQADRYTGERDIESYIDKINEAKPDLVVFTGDLISYGTRYLDTAASQLSRIRATHGVRFVIGDHDFWAGVQNVKEALRKRDIPVLDGVNSTVGAGPGHSGIRLSGVTNVYSRRAPAGEIRQLTGDSTAAAVKILATHQISDLLVDEALSNGYDLLLAGHTHGGQIRVPVIYRKFSASDFETEYVRGQYRVENLLVNVSSGLGFTLAPVRYNARPGLTVIELKSRKR